MPPRTSDQIPHGIVAVIDFPLLRGDLLGPVHNLLYRDHVLEQADGIYPKFLVRDPEDPPPHQEPRYALGFLGGCSAASFFFGFA